MLHHDPRSFRQILLLRILLFSIPILLVGQYATVRKARTSLLDTARQNLTNSAEEKAHTLQQQLATLETSLNMVTQMSTLQTGTPEAIANYLSSYSDRSPLPIDCWQLQSPTTQETVLDTCNGTPLLRASQAPWSAADLQHLVTVPGAHLIQVGQEPMGNVEGNPGLDSRANSGTDQRSLRVVLAAPVYASPEQVRYLLTISAHLPQDNQVAPRSLVGTTVIIDDQGTILSHPDPAQVGAAITSLPDAARLASIQNNVNQGRSATLHLFGFLTQGDEWLAGYSGIDIPTAPQTTERWTVLAVTPITAALQGLKDIRDVLILLTVGLILTNVVLAIVVARSLSRPIEQLSQRAAAVQDGNSWPPTPLPFRVAEIEKLSDVLGRMVQCLDERAEAVQDAWKDAELANQLKSEFLANTSHELRTPLNAIIGCIRLVRDDCCDSPEEVQEFLGRADEAALHLLRIINDILDIAKIESGTLTVHPEVLDIAPLIQEVLNLQQVQLREKALDLIAPTFSAPIWVVADRPKLKQVLLNIVYNAIKFTDQGHVQITVQTARGPGGSQETQPPPSCGKVSKPCAVLAVSDTGIGVDPDQQHKLFKPFVMVDGSTTRRFEGTGLGLAISKKLMELMGGDIYLYSQGLGKGTTVSIVVPLASASPAATQAEDKTAPQGETPESGVGDGDGSTVVGQGISDRSLTGDEVSGNIAG